MKFVMYVPAYLSFTDLTMLKFQHNSCNKPMQWHCILWHIICKYTYISPNLSLSAKGKTSKGSINYKCFFSMKLRSYTDTANIMLKG